LNQRSTLIRVTKILAGIFLAAIVYVAIDFMVDLKPSTIHSSYRFTIDDIPYDQPQLLQQDNLSIVLIKRSGTVIKRLRQGTKSLQDVLSNQSRQPQFAQNALRSRHEEFFVGYANGTDLGCLVEQKTGSRLGEICGTAEYDFAGRALKSKNQFQNLGIPDYNFSDDFKTLTIRP